MKHQRLIMLPMLLLALLFGIRSAYSSDRENTPQKNTSALKKELAFIRNEGQLRDEKNKPVPEVLLYTEVKNTGIFFQKNTISYIRYNTASVKNLPPAHKIDVAFLNTNPSVEILTENPSEARHNFYFNGSEPGIVGAMGYKKIVYHNLYNKIDIVYQVTNGQVKYDIIIRPGGRLSDIQFNIIGAERLEVKNNKIYMGTPFGDIVDEIPVSYYDDNGKQESVDFIHLNRDNNTLFFEEVSIDPSKTLVIDPVLVFFNNFGEATVNGTGSGEGFSMGNATKWEPGIGITIVGYTNSLTFYKSPGSAYGSGANERGFISHFNNSGVLQWATTIEGGGDTRLNDLSVTGAGVLFVACGVTTGTLPGTKDNSTFGNKDGFVSAFGSTGTLLRSFYIGGTGDDAATCINEMGVSYGYFIGGVTTSSTMNSKSPNPITYAGGTDGFVTSVSLSSIFFINDYTFIGSPENDEVTDIDYMYPGNGALAVTGTTGSGAFSSPGFKPVIQNVVGSNSSDGDMDIFVLNLYPPQATLLNKYYADYTTTIGTDAYDEFMPRIDTRTTFTGSPNTDFFVSFLTGSPDLNLVTTANAYQKNINAYAYNNFFISMNAHLNTVNYATYFRQAIMSPAPLPFCVKADWLGNKYLAGTTDEAAFPFTHDNTTSGNVPGTPSSNVTDIFIARINPDYSLGFIALTGGNDADVVSDLDVARDDDAGGTPVCETPILITGASTLAAAPSALVGVTYAINGKVNDDYPLTLSSSNGSLLPTTLQIVNTPYMSSITSIQWYFNGMPYGDAYDSEDLGRENVINMPGEYYAEITMNGCTFKSATITFTAPCSGEKLPDLATAVATEVGMGNTSITFSNTTYKIGSSTTVVIPAGVTLTLNNVVVVASPCSMIRVDGDGILDVTNSVLTGCDHWDGVVFNGPDASGHITGTGITNALVGVYKYYGYNTVGNVIEIDNCNFNNNNMHAAILSTDNSFYGLNGSHNLVTSSRFFGLSHYQSCEGGLEVYNILATHANPEDCYMYIESRVNNLVRVEYNYYYGPKRNNAIVVKGRNFIDCIFQYSRYRGEFRSGVVLEDIGGCTMQYDNMTSANSEYGIRIQKADMSAYVEANYIEYNSISHPAKGNGDKAAISSQNTIRTYIRYNIVRDYTNGIEFYNNEYFPFDADDHMMRSYIAVNEIYPYRSGVVVSYDQDPYDVTSPGPNIYPSNYKIGVWIGCNLIAGGDYGILGSGYLIDQIFDPTNNPPTSASPTNPSATVPLYVDADNVFQSINHWDIIWDNTSNSNASAFNYYTPSTYIPNGNPSPNAVQLNTNWVGSGYTNDFTIQTSSPLGAIADIRCAPEPSKIGAIPATNTFVKETAASSTASVYPNPVHSSFTISLPSAGQQKVEIFDLLGRIVYTTSGQATGEIRVSSSEWSNGVYFVKIYSNSQLIKTEKVLKAD